MLITLEPTFALQLQPYILIEDTYRIILVPNTMVLAVIRFNYNVNYGKRKKYTSILKGNLIDVCVYTVANLFMYYIRRHARRIQYWANNKLKDCLKKKKKKNIKTKIKTEKNAKKKSTKTCQTNRRSKIK